MCACSVDNPLAKARGLSLRTGAQIMLYLSLVALLNSLFVGGGARVLLMSLSIGVSSLLYVFTAEFLCKDLLCN